MKNKEKIINICEKTINFFILAVVFLTPLYFNILVFSTFQKYLFFRALVEILLLIYIVKIVIAGEVKIIKNKYFYLSIFAIILSQIIATVFSQHYFVSFWGSYLRQLGLFTWLHVFVFAYMVFAALGENKLKISKVFFWITLAGVISSLYALMQVSGFDFLRWEEYPGGTMDRAASTLGQPNYLGSYLIMVIPVSFYLFWTGKNIYKKSIFALFTLVELAALVSTYSRAAWLGLAAALALAALLYLWQKNRKIFYYFLVVGVLSGFLLFFGVASGKFDNQASGSLSISSRLKSFIQLKDGSAGMRTLYYQAALDIIKRNPLIGYGLDTQFYLFPRYYNPRYPVFESINVYPDRAHNEFLDIFITTGVLGLSAWIFLFFSLAKAGFSFWPDTPEDRDKKFLAASLLFAILSLWISIMFGFFTEVTLIYFWLYAAILFGIFSSEKSEKSFKFEVRDYLGILSVLSLAALTVYVVWATDVRPTLANYYYRKAMVETRKNDPASAFADFNQTIRYAPYENYYREGFAVQMLPSTLEIKDSRKKMALLDFYKNTLTAQDQNNLTLDGRAYLGLVLSMMGEGKISAGTDPANIAEFSEAQKIYEDLTKDVPGMARIYYDWGNLYFYEKKLSEAENKYEKALSLYPDFNDPAMNKEHRQAVWAEAVRVYDKLIYVKLTKKDYAGAEAGIKKAAELGANTDAYAGLLNNIKR